MYFHEDPKRTPYLYGQFQAQLVGNFENRESAQPAKDRSMATFKMIIGAYGILIGGSILNRMGAIPSNMWGFRPRFHLCLKGAQLKALYVTPLSSGEPPASASD